LLSVVEGQFVSAGGVGCLFQVYSIERPSPITSQTGAGFLQLLDRGNRLLRISRGETREAKKKQLFAVRPNRSVSGGFPMQTRKADRILAGQNHAKRKARGQSSVILSGHDSVVCGCGITTL
jgi:hypothetical protein